VGFQGEALVAGPGGLEGKGPEKLLPLAQRPPLKEGGKKAVEAEKLLRGPGVGARTAASEKPKASIMAMRALRGARLSG